MGAGFTFAISNFCMASLSHYGSLGFIFYGPMGLFWMGSELLIESYKEKQISGKYYNKEKSNYITADGKWKVQNCLLLMFGTTYFVLVGLMMMLCFAWGRKGDINPGIICSLFGICAFSTSVLFFYMYKEVLSKSHLMGMLLISISIVMLSAENASKEEIKLTEDDYSVRTYGFMAIAAGVLINIPMTMKIVVVRHFSGPSYPLWAFNRDGTFGESFVYVFILIIMCATSWQGKTLAADYFFGSLGFLSEYFGKQLATRSVKEGWAGPSICLAETQPIYTLLLCYFILGEGTSTFQIFGMIVCIAGCMVISAGDFVLERFKKT